MKVLFVCTGNTCRSPMAEGIFNKLAEEKGLAHRADSCGIYTASGLPASENSLLACAEIGVDLSGFKSTEYSDINPNDYELIAVMTESHRQALLSFGVPFEKIIVLAEETGGISDPYGGNLGRYIICRDEIISAVEELLKKYCAVSVRGLNVDDLEQVHYIVDNCFENPWSEETVKDMLLREQAALIGAFMGEKLVGFTSLEWILDEGSLTEIAVLKEYRREGIGEKLMKELFEIASEKKLSFVTLEVRESNMPAISLYKKFGFDEVGVRKDYYKSPSENAVLMTKYLQ